MALKTYKPTTPSQRQLVLVDRSRALQGQAGQGPGRGQALDRRAQQLRPRHRALARRRPQARLPPRRLQAPQARHAGDGRAARIRSEPHRVHRAHQATRTASSAYILAPQRLAVGDTIVAGAAGRREAGQRHAARRDAGRHDRPQRRDEARRAAARSRARPAPTPSMSAATRATRSCGSIRASSAWSTRTASPRSARCPTPTTATSSSARPAATAGRAACRRVRGVAMNPVDHPHGGGEGRTSGGRHPVTPWGKPTKGKKTRNNKRTNKFIVRSRHARKG